MEIRKVPVGIARGRYELSHDAANRLADAWVSEHNRLRPSLESAPDARADTVWEQQRNPKGLMIFFDIFAWVSDAVERRTRRREIVRDFGMPRAVEKRLRERFEIEIARVEVRMMHDAEMRAYLGQQLFEALERD